MKFFEPISCLTADTELYSHHEWWIGEFSNITMKLKGSGCALADRLKRSSDPVASIY